jgi:hypothetical protein
VDQQIGFMTNFKEIERLPAARAGTQGRRELCEEFHLARSREETSVLHKHTISLMERTSLLRGTPLEENRCTYLMAFLYIPTD